MRVISGKYKGKEILGYNLEGTRPTMDRVKESLFAILQNNIQDKIVLDLFAGSGSLGIEALSNGAKHCYFVDQSSEVIKVLQRNMDSFKILNATLIKNDYLNAIRNFKEQNISFDIIFLDPPYKEKYIDVAIKEILDLSLLNKEGLIICEFEENNFNNDIPNLKLIKEKKYGSKNIFIYQA